MNMWQFVISYNEYVTICNYQQKTNKNNNNNNQTAKESTMLTLMNTMSDLILLDHLFLHTYK